MCGRRPCRLPHHTHALGRTSPYHFIRAPVHPAPVVLLFPIFCLFHAPFNEQHFFFSRCPHAILGLVQQCIERLTACEHMRYNPFAHPPSFCFQFHLGSVSIFFRLHLFELPLCFLAFNNVLLLSQFGFLFSSLDPVLLLFLPSDPLEPLNLTFLLFQLFAKLLLLFCTSLPF